MANIVRPARAWSGYAVQPTVLLSHEEPEWEFRELAYGPGGSWDVVSTCLHVASHLDPLRQSLGPARAPFQLVAPSAAVSAPGDHLVGRWDGIGRGQHVVISQGFVAAAFGRDMGPDTVSRRHFAYQREPDASDGIVQGLVNALALNVRGGNPSGAVCMQTVVLAIVHHVLRLPSRSIGTAAARGGLSRAQLSLVLDRIEEKLTGNLRLTELAALLNVSTRYFCRAFRLSTGLPPHQFIIKRRVELARSLIENRTLSLGEVAHMAGFTDHSQMSATFRKVLKVPPSYFRNTRATPG